MDMRFVATVVGLTALLGASSVFAQSNVEPFKLGTFQIGSGPTVGIVLQDRYVIELDPANAALQIDPMYPRVPMPSDMLELIERYEYGLKHRIYEIVADAVTNNRLSGDGRPGYIHDVGGVRTLAPILYPGKILNAAVNFYSHACEGCTEEELNESNRKRREERGVPYLFLKPSRGAVIGTRARHRHRPRGEIRISLRSRGLRFRLRGIHRHLGSGRPSARRLRLRLGLVGR
jgi:hypothetical protein